MSKKPLPTELKLHQKSRVLEIAFADGARYRLPCEYLRVYSPSAEVRGHTPGAWKLQLGKENVNITDLQQVGGYAVKIFFDDGHNSGLYDWGYLYTLGKKSQELWDLHLERLEQAGEKRNGPDPFEVLQSELAESTTNG
jgi:DUF971 family protein